ncbi:HD domain-containing phosphohydrolase [Fusibacter ferrireducens]|uniref:Stage 0 sporulation protein A homolog n=1 Tax=Fusibacter ferrireducens TaxID=2785058 RepID=A0ABR9ZXX1_9FIRM|nr:HD domain-containing phosphohydrolase [Fusibacter ferrireducens]MBF4694414.1 response regulator [Fusibacter ferrireducens]
MDIKILIVDDSSTDMLLIKSILDGYNLVSACDGVEAMALLETDPDIDLMILDLNMPRMNGFEVLEAMKANSDFQKIAVLILTNYDELENEILGLELGAVDYIRKPLNLESLKRRIQIHVKLKSASRSLEEINTILDQTVQERTKELLLTRSITIKALMNLLETRDLESSNHTHRTQWIIKLMCEHLRKKEPYKTLLTDDYIKEIFETAPLHDIGKVGIADSILLKPSKLTQEEFEIMKQHVDFGVNALRVEIQDRLLPSFVRTAMECISGHHEKFDGTGYPKGLKGNEIPLPGRLMAIADVYDALISKRVYKEAFSHEIALEYLKENRGRHFDPDLVDAFMEIKNDVRIIVAKFDQTH